MPAKRSWCYVVYFPPLKLEGDGQRVDHRKGGATPVRKEWAEQQQKNNLCFASCYCNANISSVVILPPGRVWRPKVYHVTNSLGPLGFILGLFWVCLNFKI